MMNEEVREAPNDQIKRSVILSMLLKLEKMSLERASTGGRFSIDSEIKHDEIIRLADLESRGKKAKPPAPYKEEPR